MRLGTRSLLVAVTLVVAPWALAHDTWVRPVAGAVPGGATLRLELTSGMAFPALESPIRPERLARAEFRLGGATHPLPVVKSGKQALALSATPAASGVATVAIALAPRRLELDEAHVAEYLEEIGLAATIGPEWRARPMPRRWRETYRKLAKTFVRVGDASGDRSGLEPVGLPLELVPESDPTTLLAGTTLSIRLLKAGAPLAGIAVAAVGPGGRTLVTTDAAGRATFSLALPGPWLFAATELRPAAGGDWESDFSTMVVAVSDAASR
jgi:uncharacterized GH25 family protein